MVSDTERPWQKLYPSSVCDMTSLPTLTLGTMLKNSRNRFSDRTAMTFNDVTWSYDELFARSHAFARLLRAEGLNRGDRVAIALPNRPEYVIAVFGIVLAGGIVVQVNFRYPAAEIHRILDDSGASFVVSDTQTGTKCGAARGQFLDRRFVSIDPVKAVAEDSVEDRSPILFSGLEEFFDDGELIPETDPDDVAVLQYTGGTTGLAKGVMLTHRNLISNLEQRFAMTYAVADLPEGSKTVDVLPMCHVFALTTITLLAVRTGMNILLVSEFAPKEMLDLIRREKPAVFSGVPTMYAALLREPNLGDSGLEDVSIFNCAGAGFPLEQIERFERKTGGRIIEGFGISEASPSTHINPAFAPRKVGSVGLPLPFTDVRVVDKDASNTEELPIGEVGEMIVKGPQVTPGYWNNPEQSTAAKRDGWLLTGDLARMDHDGYFYIVGRKKEMIVTNGFNVYPAEVEQVLAKVPGMVEAAVVGVTNERRGEEVVAYISVEPETVVSDEEIDSFCREQIAAYKVPRRYIRLPALPRTPVGKIAKNKLPGLA